MQTWPWGLGSLNQRPGGFSSEQDLPEPGLSQHPGLHAGVGRETVPLQRAAGSGASQSWGWVSPGLHWTVFSCTPAIHVGQVLPWCAPVQAPGRARLCPWAGPAAPASYRDAAACHTPLLPCHQPRMLCAQGWWLSQASLAEGCVPTTQSREKHVSTVAGPSPGRDTSSGCSGKPHGERLSRAHPAPQGRKHPQCKALQRRAAGGSQAEAEQGRSMACGQGASSGQ